MLLDRSNDTSWVFPTLKSTSHFLPQFTVSCRSNSSSDPQIKSQFTVEIDRKLNLSNLKANYVVYKQFLFFPKLQKSWDSKAMYGNNCFGTFIGLIRVQTLPNFFNNLIHIYCNGITLLLNTFDMKINSCWVIEPQSSIKFTFCYVFKPPLWSHVFLSFLKLNH